MFATSNFEQINQQTSVESKTAANQICECLEDLGFTREEPISKRELERLISGIIQSHQGKLPVVIEGGQPGIDLEQIEFVETPTDVVQKAIDELTGQGYKCSCGCGFIICAEE